jgi:hypothetical protein
MRLGGRGTVISVDDIRVYDSAADTKCVYREEHDGSANAEYAGRDDLGFELDV